MKIDIIKHNNIFEGLTNKIIVTDSDNGDSQ